MASHVYRGGTNGRAHRTSQRERAMTFELMAQGHGPLGDGRTLAHWWSPAPAPQPSAPAPPVKVLVEPAEYLSIATAAQYLDCSEGLIRKFLKAPDPLPSITLGRARRIHRITLDAWLARRMAAPAGVDDILVELRTRRARIPGH